MSVSVLSVPLPYESRQKPFSFTSHTIPIVILFRQAEKFFALIILYLTLISPNEAMRSVLFKQ